MHCGRDNFVKINSVAPGLGFAAHIVHVRNAHTQCAGSNCAIHHTSAILPDQICDRIAALEIYWGALGASVSIDCNYHITGHGWTMVASPHIHFCYCGGTSFCDEPGCAPVQCGCGESKMSECCRKRCDECYCGETLFCPKCTLVECMCGEGIVAACCAESGHGVEECLQPAPSHNI